MGSMRNGLGDVKNLSYHIRNDLVTKVK